MDSDKVQRTLHIKFALPAADPAQLLAMLQGLAPFYELFGGMRIRLLQNVDDPTRFTQVIEYEAPAAVEAGRQQIASEPGMQAYLQAWRMLVPGAVELDVYREITG